MWGLPRPDGRSSPLGKAGLGHPKTEAGWMGGVGAGSSCTTGTIFALGRISVAGEMGSMGAEGGSGTRRGARGSRGTRAAGEGAAPCWGPSAGLGPLTPRPRRRSPRGSPERAWGRSGPALPNGHTNGCRGPSHPPRSGSYPGPRAPSAEGSGRVELTAKPPDQRGHSAGPVPRFRYLQVSRQDSMAPEPRSALRCGPCGCHGDGPLCGRGGAGAREQRVAPPPEGRGEGRRGRGGRRGREGGADWAPPRPRLQWVRRSAEEFQSGVRLGPRSAPSSERPSAWSPPRERPGPQGSPGLSTRGLHSSRPRTPAPSRFYLRRVGHRYPLP